MNTYKRNQIIIFWHGIITILFLSYLCFYFSHEKMIPYMFAIIILLEISFLIFSLKSEKRNSSIYKKSITDFLTGAYNRDFLDSFFKKHDVNDYIFVMIDIDHFKIVNDDYGHNIGDVVLKKLTSTIQSSIRTEKEKDYFIRLGGEEFLIVLSKNNFIEASSVISFIERIRKIIKNIEFRNEKNEPFNITVSFGVNTTYDFVESVEKALLSADIALYRAKLTRDSVVLFNEKKMNRPKLELENILSMIQSRFVISFYQPVVNLKTNVVKNNEAFIRMKNGEEMFYPSDFLNSLQKNEDKILIFKDLMDYNLDRLSEKPGFKVSINMEINELFIDSIFEHLLLIAITHQNVKGRITLEVKNTDNEILDFKELSKKLSKLKENGYILSVDNFSMSSFDFLLLSYSELFNEVKISSFLVKSLASRRNNTRNIIKYIVMFAKEHDLDVVATQIESEKVKNELIELGVIYGQGYYIEKPEEI